MVVGRPLHVSRLARQSFSTDAINRLRPTGSQVLAMTSACRNPPRNNANPNALGKGAAAAVC